MPKDLKDLLAQRAPKAAPAPPKPEAPPGNGQPQEDAPAVAQADADGILDHVEGIEVEAVVGGALQRIRLRAGTNPALVGPMLKALDPNAIVRDAFPMRGNFGNRETKLARVTVLRARVTDSGAFCELICSCNGDDFTVSVSKKNSPTFVNTVRGTGKLSEQKIAKLEKAFAEKGDVTVSLSESEQFGVQYWSTEDGKHFMDSLQADPPAAEPDKEETPDGKD